MRDFLEHGMEPQKNNNFMIYPNEKTEYCQGASEKYIFTACIDFVSYALKRKGTYEFGDKELIFYDTGKYIA